MKLPLILALLSVPALSAWFSGEGTYVLPHEISFMSYAGPAECQADQGRWEEGLCIFPASDEISVKRAGFAYEVKVATVTTNAHMCEFEGEGVFQNDGSLKAQAPSEVWNEARQEWEPGTCEVTVAFADGEHADVANNGQCQSFCGMRATLAFKGAARR